MRHGKKINHLSRKSAHRKAMLANMATSLILHKRISTTVAKAKALRKFVEPIITKAKTDTTHSRRVIFSYLRHKDPIKELFSVVADKVGDRPGGYTRIFKTGTRLGDNAETCIIELVDFDEIYIKKDKDKPGKKRTRRGGKKTIASPKVDKVKVEETTVDKETDEAEIKDEKTDVKAEITEVAKDESEDVENVEDVKEEPEKPEDEPKVEEVPEEPKDEKQADKPIEKEIVEEAKVDLAETPAEDTKERQPDKEEAEESPQDKSPEAKSEEEENKEDDKKEDNSEDNKPENNKE